MQIIRNIFDLNKAIKKFNNFGYVPTMGGIHKGHISLIKHSQKKCKKTIVSIFVNPTQFNNKKDFIRYPRNLQKDIKILKNSNVDIIFIPDEKEIYKKKLRNFKLNYSDKILCVLHRKGHFEGVLNVMNRLLLIIKSKKIFMGEKDFQQIHLIKKYLSKKHKVNIISCKTIRDNKGVAFSTRNNLLSKSQYFLLAKITNELKNLKNKFIQKKIKSNFDISEKCKQLEILYKVKFDYLELRNEINLSKKLAGNNFRLFVAFWINSVRIIDNF